MKDTPGGRQYAIIGATLHRGAVVQPWNSRGPRFGRAVRWSGMKLPAFISSHLDAIERELDRVTPPESAQPQALHRAMRYTLMAPSKRVRAVLVLLSAEVCGGARAGAARGSRRRTGACRVAHPR